MIAPTVCGALAGLSAALALVAAFEPDDYPRFGVTCGLFLVLSVLLLVIALALA